MVENSGGGERRVRRVNIEVHGKEGHVREGCCEEKGGCVAGRVSALCTCERVCGQTHSTSENRSVSTIRFVTAAVCLIGV